MADAMVIQSLPEDSQTTGSGLGESSSPRTRSRAEKSLNGLLAALVTIYGILMALVISAASRAEGLYYDNVFTAQAQLNDASELSIEAQIGILHDLLVLQQMQVHEFSGSDPEIVAFFYDYMSDEARASLERSGGIDDIYAETVYLAHNVERENAMRSFDLAGAWSERASLYEVFTTVLAVGLAFAAWASLVEREGAIRWMFTVIAALILIGSLSFLAFHLATREPLDEYFMPPDDQVGASVEERQSVLAGEHCVYPSSALELARPAGWELANVLSVG